MELKIIKNEKQYQGLLNWIDEMFDKKVKRNTPDGEKLQVALLLVKQYEDEHYTISTPDTIEAVRLKMEENGLKSIDFVGKVGSKGYVSAVFNKKKPLTLEMAKLFHQELGVSAEVLLA